VLSGTVTAFQILALVMLSVPSSPVPTALFYMREFATASAASYVPPTTPPVKSPTVPKMPAATLDGSKNISSGRR